MYDEINQDKFVRECEHYIEENVAAPYATLLFGRIINHYIDFLTSNPCLSINSISQLL
jgi:hypothetical protein